MRCNPVRWSWGIIPIAMLSWIAYDWERPNIEADLMRRSAEMLERSGQGWAAAAFTGRDAVVSGRATEDGAPKSALDAVRSVWGVRVGQLRTDLVATVASYVWSAAVSDRKLRLSGLAPDEETEKAIIALVEANFPRAEIDNDMTLARGGPRRDLWLGRIGFGLEQLAGLKRGVVDIEGTSLAVAGEAAGIASFKSIQRALAGGLPAGIALATNKVTPPVADPFTWSARLAQNHLLLSGHVPSEATRNVLFAEAKKNFPRLVIIDRTETAAGAHDRFLEMVTTGLVLLRQLKEGVAEVRGRDMSLSGTAETEAAASAVRRAMADAGPFLRRTLDAIKVSNPEVTVKAPFLTVIEVAGDTIRLSGSAPSEAARVALVSGIRASLPDKSIKDGWQIAAGAPESWAVCMLAGVAGLGRLGAGRAQLVDRRLEVTGETGEDSVSEAVPGEVRAAVNKACDATIRINLKLPAEASRTPRPKHGEGAGAGDGPRRAAADADIKVGMEAYAATVRDAEMKGRIETQAVGRGPADAARPNAGEAEMKAKMEAYAAARRDAEQKARLETEAAARGEADVAQARPRAEPASQEQRKAEAKRCQQRLSEAAEKGVILFERASAEIDPRSSATLDRLAEIARACQGARIEVGGHTDAEGEPARNQSLSQRRAGAVMTYLSKAGIDASRLTAVGYGAERPKAPNDTPEDRARNRRIEFTVIAN